MLSSPHTIGLYDFGQSEDGSFYHVMELLHGVDLRTLVAEHGPIAADRTSHFLLQICASLEEAHRNGLVHRDIKPANVYLCRYGLEFDFIKVLDFGIAKFIERFPEQTQITATNAPAGTPGFMAPEMVLGREIDARADIYAVGCVAYWLLTGRLVSEEENYMAVMMAHASKPPVPPSRRTGIKIPPQLEHLTMSCLQKDPETRPASVGEIRRALLQDAIFKSWTPERAEKWWQLHMPKHAGARGPLETGEPPLKMEWRRRQTESGSRRRAVLESCVRRIDRGRAYPAVFLTENLVTEPGTGLDDRVARFATHHRRGL